VELLTRVKKKCGAWAERIICEEHAHGRCTVLRSTCAEKVR